jgi:hypothetical protein
MVASHEALEHPAETARPALTFLAVAVEEVADSVEHSVKPPGGRTQTGPIV